MLLASPLYALLYRRVVFFREDFFVRNLIPVALRVSAGIFVRPTAPSVPLLTQRATMPLVAAIGGGSAALRLFATICRSFAATLPCRASRRLGRAGGVLLASMALTLAAAEPKRFFDIPAGTADKTLREFAAQSGVEILFATEAAAGVQTNSVKGDFAAREAVQQMLQGTPLHVVNDEKNRVIRIGRPPPAKNPARHPEPDRPRPVHSRTEAYNDPVSTTTMNRKNPLAVLFGWLALSFTPTHAVSAADGSSAAASAQSTATLTGQVSNAATSLFLEGALVSLVGSNRNAITDREGRFRFSGLPAESVTLAVSYTGLTTKEMPVTLSPGQNAVLDVALTSDIYVMDQFTVAGIREGQAMAITQQRNAPNVKNVSATDAFGNIADGNPAEALRLLPGVSAINDENESRFVMVRGIDANLNSMTIDGMKLSTGGTGSTRQSDMSQIPLGAIEIMEITKSPTPDMDGDSVGGNVNLRSASIFDRANPRRITFAFSASMRTFGDSAPATTATHDRIRPTYAVGYADVFGPKKNIGISLNLSHTINWAPSAGLLLNTYQTTPTYPAYLRVFTHYDYHSTERARTGANLRLDFKLSENSRFYLNSSYTGYTSKQMFKGGGASVTGLAQVATLDADGRPIPFQTQFPFGHPSYRAGGFNAAGARVQASILPGYTDEVTEMVNATYGAISNLDHSKSERYAYQANAIHRFGDLEIDYSGLYQTNAAWRGGRDGNRDFIRSYRIMVPNTAWRLDGTRTNDRARREVTQTGGVDVRNSMNWTLDTLASTVTEQTTDLYGGQFNLKRHFQSPVPTYLKAGIKFMSEDRHTTNPNVAYTYVGPREALAGLVDTSIKTGVPTDKFHPFGVAPTYLSVDKISQLRADNPQYFTFNAATARQNALQNDKTAKEEVLAAYVMGNVTIDRLSVLGGIRVERTDVSGESAVQDPAAGVGITDAVQRTQAIWGNRLAVKRDYQNVLPGLHLKYEATRNTLIRGSYSSSFGRPSFGSVYPDTRINYDSERVTQNNPGLLPQTADNFDVSIEHYFEPIGVISAGVFLKEIKNFLYSSVVRIPSGGDNGFDGDFAGWELATQANGGYGRVRGAEINYSQQLSFLPGFWSGFGIFANFTYLETEGNYGRVAAAPSSALVNFIPKVANGGLSYSRGKFSGRFNVNSTGDYLRAYNANPLLRGYRKVKTMVDLKLAYRYTNEISVFADVANVFNAKDRYYVGSTPLNFTAVRNFGVRLQAGVTGTF